MNKRCIDCGERKRCSDTAASTFFFIIGLVAIVAVRAVTILAHVKPFYGQIAWYIGVLGFILYFAYKYKIDRSRAASIRQNGLIEKMMQGRSIEKEDREMIGAVLCAISSRKDSISYLMIFLSSAIVLVVAVYLDFIK